MIDIDRFQNRLEEEKGELEKQLETIARPSAENPGEWEAIQTDTSLEADPHDQADLLDQYQENRALVEVLGPRYHQVLAALERIKQGTYGIDEIDQEPIEEERLEADPAATTRKANLS